MKNNLHSTEKKRETGILIGVDTYQSDYNFDSTMKELASLAETCQIDVKHTFQQNRTQVNYKYYVGKGKLQDIKDFINMYDIDVIIANDELSTAQSNNLNDTLGIKVIDRTQLILEIFAMRAQSKAGKLQVEYAQLNYLLPRLMGHGKSLSRLGGGIGTRGPGETKLETDRRHIRTRMNEIKQKLNEVISHRERYHHQRKQNDVFQIALVGYTNAGKSSWFNQLTSAETYEKNKLFATLDSKTRKLTLNEGFEVILSDTVGFIQKLPTTLIDAFKSTLEEVMQADLLIHVVDVSHPDYKTHIDTVNQIIKELDSDHIPQVILLNKRDLASDEAPIEVNPSLFVSTQIQEDTERVKALIISQIKSQFDYYERKLQSDEADLLYALKQQTLVTSLEFDENEEVYIIKGYQNK
ncbi:GTPase HflX [Staphylococcus sp. 11261D007BR]